MGGLSSLWDFDKYWLGEGVWGQLEDDPWRLLLGATGPVGTEFWGSVLGKDDWEPFHNVLGGPHGSGFLGLGSGGIYDDYIEYGGPESQRDERIKNKQLAVKGHDAAEILTVLIAGGAAAGVGGGGAGGAGAGGSGSGATTFALPESGALGGGEFLNAAGEPIAGAGGGGFWGNLFGGEGGFGGMDFANMNWSDPQTYMQLGNMMPQGGMPGQRQVEPQPTGPPPLMAEGAGLSPPEGMPPPFSPPRTNPFMGLIDDEYQAMMLGGLLT